MVNESNKDLEKALSGLAENKEAAETPAEASEAPQLPKEEEIGFHKGALNTLAAERNELIKMIANVEAIMQAHLKRLEELGVNIQTQSPEENKQ